MQIPPWVDEKVKNAINTTRNFVEDHSNEALQEWLASDEAKTSREERAALFRRRMLAGTAFHAAGLEMQGCSFIL